MVMIRSGICAGMLIKVTGDRKEAFAAVADVWRGMTKEVIGFPTEPDMNYLVDELNSSLTEERNTMTLVSVFMILSILISALGLFAMSVYFADQQKKSISLHKVFGAETGQAVLHLSRPFIMASLVAIAVATPVSVIFMRHYLEGFYNRIDFPWWVLLITAVVSLLIKSNFSAFFCSRTRSYQVGGLQLTTKLCITAVFCQFRKHEFQNHIAIL